jgi:NAD-dependent deacetylase
MAQLKTILGNAGRIVFFGGAGVSTESGIPDFRGAGGLFKHAPETMLSYSFFISHPEEFYRFYREKMIHPDAKPNQAHLALAELERQGKLTAVVTQNIDGLHTAAGSVNVLELHGSVYRNYCMRCKGAHPLEAVTQAVGVPHCPCGGVIRPDVVLYEEGLNPDVLDAAAQAIQSADVLIVGGTSLNVYPAAGLLRYFQGGNLVLINKSETPYDRYAGLIIRDSIGDALGKAVLDSE